MTTNRPEATWDEETIDVSADANFIWSIANKIRGVYMPDKYGDVILPMTIIRRFECALAQTKAKVVEKYEANDKYPEQALRKLSGFPFYNTSRYTLEELGKDPDHLAENFKYYVKSFSKNVSEIFTNLEFETHIDKMDKGNCLLTVVLAFAELDLSIETYDSIKMGYIFENLIGRFYQNVDAGQFYTGRDIIRVMVSLLLAEGSDDVFEPGKVITVCDQAAGTGGMLTTAYSYLKHINPSADVRLFGQELMPQTYSVGLAEMLIKGQAAENYRNADTFAYDCFPDVKMRYLLENPPFGTPWGGKDAKDGQEEAVKKEFAKGNRGRWGAGLPGTSDAQLIFMQSALAKLDAKGRAAIIENASPLFTGDAKSGESQIRRWLLEEDYVEAIIQMPTDMFYNTGISTYIWILSKDKISRRRGYVQLIDASSICTKLRKNIGDKKNEFSKENREQIVKLYVDFTENEFCKIFPNTEFIYREYTVKQPLQRSYSITKESIQALCQSNALNPVWDRASIEKLQNKQETDELTAKERQKLQKLESGKPLYDAIIAVLESNVKTKKWLSLDVFLPVLSKIFQPLDIDKKLIKRIADALSVMDKDAQLQYDKAGNLLYDDETKDVERVRYDEDINTYMQREVWSHIPDASYFWEENLTAKPPVIKTGAEIPFTRYFYKYQESILSETIAKQIIELENKISEHFHNIFGDIK